MNKFPAKVVKIIDAYQFAINRGSTDGVVTGQRFLIYALGPELRDPDTGESLGCLELVRGKAKVVHVQDRMSTLDSDNFFPQKKRIVKTSGGVAALMGRSEEIISDDPDKKPFDVLNEGDLVKPI